VNDLWVENSALIKVSFINLLHSNSGILSLIIFALCSCLASLFAGIFVFRKDKIYKRKFALFGLFNFLTLIGFVVAAIYLKTRNIKSSLRKQFKSEKIIILDNRKFIFVLLFSVLFLMLTYVFQALLSAIL